MPSSEYTSTKGSPKTRTYVSMSDIGQPDDIHPELGKIDAQNYELKHAPARAALNAKSANDCVQQASEVEASAAKSKIVDPHDATPGDGTKDTIQPQRNPIDDEGKDGDEDNDELEDHVDNESNGDSDEDFPRFDTDAPRGRITKPVAGPKPPRPKPKQPYQIASP